MGEGLYYARSPPLSIVQRGSLGVDNSDLVKVAAWLVKKFRDLRYVRILVRAVRQPKIFVVS